jgi:DNA-binding CsgD family transcriptional regulator
MVPSGWIVSGGVAVTFRGSGPIDPAAIYEAVDDDEAFAALPAMLAASVGARSTSMVWQPTSGGVTILGHSGYFRVQDYADYVDRFADADVWIDAADKAGRRGVVWNLDELVSEREYLSSRFYNEWIRGMGDDTFHCLGLTIASEYGTGVLGLHRGRGAERFDGGETAILDHMLPDLKRLFVIRGQLATYRNAARQASDLLDRLDQPVILLAADGSLTTANRAGEALIGRHGALHLIEGRVEALGRAAASFAAAVARATCREAPRAASLALQSPDGATLRLIISPYRDPAGRRLALVLGPALSQVSQIKATLRGMFLLTASEADIAFEVAQGRTLKQIADSRNSTYQTVRSQMKAVTSKLNCSRQSEVAIVVSQVSAVV